jgi:hypothetical protein
MVKSRKSRRAGWYVEVGDDQDQPEHQGPHATRRLAERANELYFEGEGGVVYDGGASETAAMMMDC